MTPGFANMFQNGTDPSAKSSHNGALPKSEQFACSGWAGAPFPPVSARASDSDEDP